MKTAPFPFISKALKALRPCLSKKTNKKLKETYRKCIAYVNISFGRVYFWLRSDGHYFLRILVGGSFLERIGK
jgi:hypothetical protein